MLNEVKRIIELTTNDNIDFITLKDENGGIRCLFFSEKGSYIDLFLKKELLINEMKSHAIANIIYGSQATKLLMRLHKWMQV